MADGPWTKYGQPAPAEDGPWAKYGAQSPGTTPPQAQQEPTGALHGAEQGVGDVVGGITSLPHALMHPIDTLNSISDQQSGLGDRAVQDFKSGHYGNALWHGVDAALPVLGPMDAALTDQYQSGDKSGALARGIVNALPYALPHAMSEGVGEGMKSAGGKLIDRTVGVRKADVARGAQPGRAYLEGGGNPALTMRSLANKAGSIADKTGEQLGNKYDEATNAGVTIPSQRIASVLDSPINKAMSIKEGPGGAGGTSAFQEYRSSFDPLLQKPNLTPNEVFAAKKNVAANTRWNDPTQFDLNKVRQMNVGGLGGELTDAVPGTAKLNKVYQGTTNLARRAGERADTGQSPLTQIGRRAMETGLGATAAMAAHNPLLAGVPLLLDSVPAKTGLAKALFAGGQAVPAAAPLAKTIGPLSGIGRASSGFSPERKAEGKKND
jgi:hypothetical protein